MSKISYTPEERRIWHNSLPSKKLSAGLLLRNEEGKLLIVKPNYRDHWNLPGGVVDEGESPLSAVIREAKEEIGLSFKASDLKFCLVDYRSPQDGFQDIICFWFDGGVISREQTDAIKLQISELDDYKFVAEDKAVTMLSNFKNKELKTYLNAKSDFLYLENGETKTIDQ